VLALLRGEAAARPSFDPTLAGGLRAWLEDAAYEVVAVRGEHAPPLLLGPHELFGAPGGPAAPSGWRENDDDDNVNDHDPGDVDHGPDTCGEPSAELLVSRLVHAVFRLLVHACALDDPLRDALDALRAGGNVVVVRHVESLGASERAALAETIGAHAAHLARLVPRLAPGWMPRTGDRVAIPLAGGRVVLHGVFDLLVGLPHRSTATMCAVGLATGGPWSQERRALHYLALLQTLRSGVPPFRMALLESPSGRYGVEDVREEHLRAIASHLCAWLTCPGDADV
jgi:hypothetical protein